MTDNDKDDGIPKCEWPAFVVIIKNVKCSKFQFGLSRNKHVSFFVGWYLFDQLPNIAESVLPERCFFYVRKVNIPGFPCYLNCWNLKQINSKTFLPDSIVNEMIIWWIVVTHTEEILIILRYPHPLNLNMFTNLISKRQKGSTHNCI